MRIERYLDALASSAIREALALTEDPAALLRPTQDPKHGDYQVNAAMALGKRLGKPPHEIATAIAERLGTEDAIEAAEVAGPGFVNLRLSDGWIAGVLSEALRDEERSGCPRADAPQKIVIDFSAPNIAKQMHVGHLRSTIIGDALCRILRFAGHEVIGDNHLGDWGTQFGLLIAGMRELGDESALDDHPIEELERIYRLASARAKEDEPFAERARAELKKLQAGDPENHALWQLFVASTRRSLETIYARLGVHFDVWLGESAYNEMLEDVCRLLVDRGIAREDQGALCVFWDEIPTAPAPLKKQKEPFIIRKRDGAFLYSTTDVATLLYRRDHFQADRAIYVVDDRQSLHFRQLFAIAALLEIPLALDHVGFGKILGEDGKPLRTRDGGNILLSALLDEAEERARARIEEQIASGKMRLEATDVPAVAEAVGIGAVKWADLRQNRQSDYQFDWDKLVTFQGNAGPYMQYAYARIQSIFRKGDIDTEAVGRSARISPELPAEIELARALLKFSDAVHQASETLLPHLICDHLFGVAKAFSSFYNAASVLDAKDEGTKESRLGLCLLAARQLALGLDLLGIRVVDRM